MAKDKLIAELDKIRAYNEARASQALAESVDRNIMKSYKAGLLGTSPGRIIKSSPTITGIWHDEKDTIPKLQRFETQKEVIKAIHPRLKPDSALYRARTLFLESLVDSVVALVPTEHVPKDSYFELDTRKQVVTVFMSTNHVDDKADVLTVYRTKSYANV